MKLIFCTKIINKIIVKYLYLKEIYNNINYILTLKFKKNWNGGDYYEHWSNTSKQKLASLG